MISFPNAKINLGLNVIRRREDGFHDIQSVLVPVKFRDILEILPGDGGQDTISMTGIRVPGHDEDNLCLKACRLFREEHGAGYVGVHLHKVIPPGSGLGGGSSDAAHTLKMMENLSGKNMPEEELMKLSGTLGSDCPFFIWNRPALASGRGEVLKEVNTDLSDKQVLILLPGIHISTAWAYSQIQPRSPELALDEVIAMEIREWKNILVNDFEKPVFEKYPLLKNLRDRLYTAGAIYAAMSGSGSSIFGIFNRIPDSVDTDFPGIHIIKTGFLL